MYYYLRYLLDLGALGRLSSGFAFPLALFTVRLVILKPWHLVIICILVFWFGPEVAHVAQVWHAAGATAKLGEV